MTIYFAYGANMDPVHMAEQCPGAERLGLGELRDHAFGIAAGGFGTLRPAVGRTGLGVLWNLTPAHLAALDAFEGVAENFYRRHTVSVTTAAGGRVEATVYRPTDDSPGAPAAGYLERIIEVAQLLEFPPEYVDGISKLLLSEERPAADSR